MRCVICGIRHETNTFSTLKTELKDFHVIRGSEMQLGEFWKSFDDIEWIPTLSAGAIVFPEKIFTFEIISPFLVLFIGERRDDYEHKAS